MEYPNLVHSGVFGPKYNVYNSSDHDNLARCAACSQKFNRQELQLFGGRLICKYCLHDLEMNLTYTPPGRDE